MNYGFPGGLMVPTFGDFKRDLLPLMEDFFHEHQIRYVYKNLAYFKFPWNPKPLYIVSAERKLRGPNWGYGLINELTLIDYMRFKEFIGRIRMRGAPCPQIATNGTPEGIGSEYYEKFIEKPFHTGLKVIYGDTRDNAMNLSEDYISTLEQSFDSIMLDAYLKGLFINMQGNRFYYNYDPSKNDDPTIQEDLDDRVLVSLDFNVEFMTATIWQYQGILKAFDEIVIPNNADTYKMCDALKERGYTPARTTIYPDPAGKARKTSGKADIQILKEAGFYDVRFRSRAPDFRSRQLNANNLLEKKIVKLNPTKCSALKKDLIAVTQNPGTLEKDKENKRLTHASDGFDYMIEQLFPMSGKRNSTIEKFR
jgi:hypothetical protein